MHEPRSRLLAVLACLGCAASYACNVKYNNNYAKPLLFGGVSSECISGCGPRDSSDHWAGVCAYDSRSSVWGVCTPEQAQHSLEYARTLGGGAVLQLSPCDFVTYLRGRTLWLLGDSHSKTLYRALQCFLYDFWDHHECQVSTQPDEVAAVLHQPAADGISNCFHLTGDGGGRVCMIQVVLAMNLLNSTQVADGGVLPFLHSRLAAPSDIFYVNIGSWHRKSDVWGKAYQPALNALGKYYHATKSTWPHLIFRETPALHPMNMSSKTCTPLTGYEYKPKTGRVVLSKAAQDDTNMQWVNGAALNRIARDTLYKYDIPVMPAFNISAPLVDNHNGMRMSASLDCLHYCNPGVPEMWVWYLYNAMRAGKTGIKPLSAPAAEPLGSSRTTEVVRARDPSAARQDVAHGPAGVSAPTATQGKEKVAGADKQLRQQSSFGKYACAPSIIRL